MIAQLEDASSTSPLISRNVGIGSLGHLYDSLAQSLSLDVLGPSNIFLASVIVLQEGQHIIIDIIHTKDSLVMKKLRKEWSNKEKIYVSRAKYTTETTPRQ